MDSNEQTELTSKIETDSESLTPVREGGVIEQNRKEREKTHEHRRQCGDCHTVGREEVGEGIVAINGDGQGLDWGW